MKRHFLVTTENTECADQTEVRTCLFSIGPKALGRLKSDLAYVDSLGNLVNYLEHPLAMDDSISFLTQVTTFLQASEDCRAFGTGMVEFAVKSKGPHVQEISQGGAQLILENIGYGKGFLPNKLEIPRFGYDKRVSLLVGKNNEFRFRIYLKGHACHVDTIPMNFESIFGQSAE